LLGFVNISLIVEPEPLLAPVMLPVIVPTVQLNVLDIVAVKLIFGLVPLQVLTDAALVTDGTWLKVIATSSVDAVQGLLEIVHLKVYVCPATPLKFVVELFVLAKDPPVPDTILHKPVPIEGVLAASVTVVNPQVAVPVWSGPAFAVVGL